MPSKIIILFLSILLFSCSEKKSIDVLYLKIYKDILIVGSQTNDSIEAKIKKDSVFNSYNMTESDFRKWTIELAKDRDIYLKTLDSLRNSVLIEERKLKNSQDHQ